MELFLLLLATIVAIVAIKKSRHSRHSAPGGQVTPMTPPIPQPHPGLHATAAAPSSPPRFRPQPVPPSAPPGEQLVEWWKPVVALLFPPVMAVFLIYWIIVSFTGVARATLILLELLVGVLGYVIAAVSEAISPPDPARLAALAARRQHLSSDAGRLSRAAVRPLLVLAEVFGVQKLIVHLWRKANAPATPPMPPVAPAPFADRYVVLDDIPGAGSGAELYVVRRIDDHAPVPQRLLLKCFDLTRGAWLDSLVRESEGMKLAKRVGLVTDYMFGDDYFYYVMPFYSGETLHDAALRPFASLGASAGLAPADLRRALAWVRDLLVLEIQRYHEAGLIHKDIKPDNVILEGSRPRLIDVGLVTQLGSAMTLTTHGTEYFRDPELVRQAVAGTKVKDLPAERFDLYSTGALLYFVTQGTFPATGPFSRSLRPVPYAVSAIAMKAMSDFDKRYTSAASMAADLDAVLAASDLERVALPSLPSFRAAAAAAPALAPDSAPPPAPAGAAAPAPGSQPRRPRRRALLFASAVALIVGVLVMRRTESWPQVSEFGTQALDAVPWSSRESADAVPTLTREAVDPGFGLVLASALDGLSASGREVVVLGDRSRFSEALERAGALVGSIRFVTPRELRQRNPAAAGALEGAERALIDGLSADAFGGSVSPDRQAEVAALGKASAALEEILGRRAPVIFYYRQRGPERLDAFAAGRTFSAQRTRPERVFRIVTENP